MREFHALQFNCRCCKPMTILVIGLAYRIECESIELRSKAVTRDAAVGKVARLDIIGVVDESGEDGVEHCVAQVMELAREQKQRLSLVILTIII